MTDHYQGDVCDGDRNHGCKPRCVVTPLRKSRHVPIVAWGPDDRRTESHDDETPPSKTSSDSPGDKKDVRTEGNIDEQERQHVRPQVDRHMPHPCPFTQSDNTD